MENKALITVEKYNMLSFGDSVVIGLSGGADSVALTHFLLSLKKRFGLRIFACHINHGLRGAEADRDESFVRKLCRENDIELFVLHKNILQIAQQRKISTEQCGREVRYKFFEETAQKFDAKIATAHTASDNTETVIFNMTRGCGIKGLCGIPPIRGNIIRPLIEVSRSDIENYCRKNNYEYITDSTNLERDYTRNKIRLDVVPVLKGINPSVEESISRMSFYMRENERFINDYARKILESAKTKNGYKTDILLQTDASVLSQIIILLSSQYNIIPESKHIEMIKEIIYNGGAVNIKKDIKVVSKQGFLRIIKVDKSVNNDEIIFYGQDAVLINNKKICLLKMNMDEFNKYKKINNLLFNNSMDYDTIPSDGTFRTRRSGDTFTLPFRKITKSLKKLFNEMKIPQEIRNNILVFASGSEILWIEGIGVSYGYGITESTKNVLTFNVDN